MKPFPAIALLGLSLTLGACSVLEENKIDYKSSGKAPSLEVPPDLTQLSRDNRYTVPAAGVTASGFQATQATQALPTIAAGKVGDVRIERAGNQRWLVVDRPAEQLWQPIRDFWQEGGFILLLNQQDLGIMETDWAENRAKIPQDFLRGAIGKWLDVLYSTGERDRFRTRLERNAGGGTDIFISHRGMIETFSNIDKSQTMWQPRPSDPELEAEFLRRLMVKLGVAQEQAATALKAAPPPTTSKVALQGQVPVVQVSEGFDRTWRRLGLSLDRTGFTVEDRDRSAGVYFVRYVAPDAGKEEPGLLSRWFGSAPAVRPPEKYRIVLKSVGDLSTISVLNAAGAPETSASAQRIVQIIADDLK